jgi:hypothetical protein
MLQEGNHREIVQYSWLFIALYYGLPVPVWLAAGLGAWSSTVHISYVMHYVLQIQMKDPATVASGADPNHGNGQDNRTFVF